MKRKAIFILVTTFLILVLSCSHNNTVQFTGNNGADLQQLIDSVQPETIINCDTTKQLVISKPLVIKKALTLNGLNAKLPNGLGRTSIILVNAPNVVLTNLTLRGNYDSVDQKDRKPLVDISQSNFLIQDCTFYDSSKDGVQICPKDDDGDIIDGVVKNIKAFRIGRDAVSISGGNKGQFVRDIRVENVSIKKGYLRGAVEVSYGTENISVKNVYAEDCPYAIDVQDHQGDSAPNINVYVEQVKAVNCKHIIRTANSPRGHSGLFLKNLTGIECESPVQISNTNNVTIKGLYIKKHNSKDQAPISLRNCKQISLSDINVETLYFGDQPLQIENCTDIQSENIIQI